jgi:hypothetical protein
MKPALLGVLLLAADLASCPADSKTPFAEESDVAFEAQVAGRWRCVGPGEAKAALVEISRRGPTVLEAVIDPGSKDTGRVRLHAARSGGQALVNVEMFGSDDPEKWSLARMTLLRPSVLHVEVAREKPFETVPDSARRSVIERGLRDGGLFDDFWVCVRAEEVKR